MVLAGFVIAAGSGVNFDAGGKFQRLMLWSVTC